MSFVIAVSKKGCFAFFAIVLTQRDTSLGRFVYSFFFVALLSLLSFLEKNIGS